MRYDMEKCGERIRKLRLSHSMTQLQLALELHITDSSLCNMEKGKRSPSVETLVQLAEYFGVSLDYLILGEDAKAQNQQILAEVKAAAAHLQMIQNLAEM